MFLSYPTYLLGNLSLVITTERHFTATNIILFLAKDFYRLLNEMWKITPTLETWKMKNDPDPSTNADLYKVAVRLPDEQSF